MATYSDSMIGFADWKSSGRSFAFVAALAAALGGVALYISQKDTKLLAAGSADRFFGSVLGWIAVGVSAVFILAVVGSLSITRRARYALVVSAQGVLRQSPRGDLFLSRDEIIGMARMEGRGLLRGGVALITEDPRRRIVIARSLANYGACLDELRSMGVAELPPLRRSRKRILAVWLMRLCALWEVLTAIDRSRSSMFAYQTAAIIAGGAALSALFVWLAWRVESYPAEVFRR